MLTMLIQILIKNITLLVILFLNNAFGQQWSIGYYTQFGTPIPPSAIQWDGLTHVIQGEAFVNSDGTLDLKTYRFSAIAPDLIATAHNANVKVLVGLEQAYWLGGPNQVQQAVTNHLGEFVNNVVNLVDTYGFDGVDIDWEPFEPAANGPAMNTLLAALRSRLGTKVITVAAMGTNYTYWGGTPAQYVDRINVMTYDLGGLWDPYSWHNSALQSSTSDVWSVDLAVQRFTTAGVPRDKLGIGLPFYGIQWKGGGISGPYQHWTSTPDRQQIAYNQIVPEITSGNSARDPTAQVPYLYNNAGIPSFLSYDDEQSIAAKVNYAKAKHLGGWIIWHLSQDYFPGGNPQHPLMTAIRNAMGSSIRTPASPNQRQPAARRPRRC
jgi:chitinase